MFPPSRTLSRTTTACLLRQKDVPHHCQPKWALCAGEHVTSSKEWPKRFLPPVSRSKKQREVTKGRRTSRESRSRSISRGPSRERSKTRFQVQVPRENTFRQAKIC
ncbi:hypothetical protein HPB48_004487 [Haemaphysalis longicornis]|uniref:Uncharacterized protein n=1 Tax=Haemaphysalis longicornis TaxID=44386 RepID=A0A9J6G9U6_HAELO|nr:hypothetical protein HPB48_004487 [Haemaphysalis longicornis]